ncbi:cytochrome oxidase putative small subunit CydP [Geopseudomonas aromaticivorans]
MPQATPPSPWRIPLVREIAVILLIKLAILLTIKAVWFTEPTVPENGSQRVSERLLGPAQPQPLPLNEEEPR